MKRLSLVVLVVSLLIMINSASAQFEFNEVTPVGGPYKWSSDLNWDGGVKPNGTAEIKIRYGRTCLLDSVEGPFASPGDNWEYTRVYGGATLNIVDGAVLRATSWMRVGTDGGTGYVNQTGGLVELNVGHSSDKLMVGDDPGSAGSEYRISGGTLTHIGTNGGLWQGYEGGTGQFTVIGTDPVIQMNKLYVGGDRKSETDTSDWGVGYLKYEISAAGVSPIELASNIYINRGSKTAGSMAHLVLQLDAAPPSTAGVLDTIVLAKNAGTAPIEGDQYDAANIGRFDTVTGAASGAHLAPVTLSFGGTDYHYMLSYYYNADAGAVANDLALIPEPATLVLLGLGGLVALRRRK